MATTHCTRPTSQMSEPSDIMELARELRANGEGGDNLATAVRRAIKLVPELAIVAEQWDAQAERDISPMGETQVLPMGNTTPASAEPLYIPSALEPHEQRAVDKALFMRAGGIVPRRVGRFFFVPSRTRSDGTVYRVTLDSCTCEAYANNRLCWHRALIGIERELAA